MILHVRTLSGLEEVLAQELIGLGAQKVHRENRVVICEGDLRLMYAANIHCRTAIRVLRPIARFPAPDEQSLYNGIQSIEWAPW